MYFTRDSYNMKMVVLYSELYSTSLQVEMTGFLKVSLYY